MKVEYSHKELRPALSLPVFLLFLDKRFLCLKVENDVGLFAGWTESDDSDNHMCYNLDTGRTVRKDCPRGNYLLTHLPHRQEGLSQR